MAFIRERKVGCDIFVRVLKANDSGHALFTE